MSAARLSWLAVPAAAGLIAAVLLVGGRRDDRGPSCRGLLIPAYVPPDEVQGVARSVRSGVLVINPASGPGAEARVGYEDAVRAAQRSGARVLGYVPTDYGARDEAAVAADIDRYESWYGTDGIFLDEAASGADRIPYYRGLAAHVRAAGKRLVVLNPGVVPDRGYFGVADVVVTFEGAYASYAGAREREPGWLRDVPAGQIAVLVYDASAGDAAAVIASTPHAGHVYATPGRLPHPWGTVPDDLAGQHAGLAGCGGADPMASLSAPQGRSRAKTRLSHVADPRHAS